MAPKNARYFKHEGKDIPILDLETIDFEKLVCNDIDEVQRLLKSCQNEGFFYLDLRSINGRRQIDDKDRLLGFMRRFFHSKFADKNEIGLPEQKHGYEPIGLHAGLDNDSRDGYECLKVSLSELSKDTDLNLPRIINNNDVKILRDFAAGGDLITKTMLSCLSNVLGLTGENRFESFHRNWRPSNSTLAMFRYIPSEETETHAPGQKSTGHQQHTDIGSFTLLFSDQYGLQVQPANEANAEFGFVEPRDGHAIINVGDSLRFASGHQLYSCIHRVVPLNEERYSIAYFLRPEVDKTFRDSEGRTLTAGQWHDEKYEVFASTHEDQATKVPKTMLLGGMPERIAQGVLVG
ncbi:hypothetical protein PFICI_12432 [Pestalotiopsis fici W106-1]|uniref:Fe2OG dioxygenase domain-containing protein n=1 Tax=Pestalotiopsis fici (strain W106-1 / CGMCC3.15140) TaxID=1229662 RepID=W3WNQ1_PESFW|nr:uncharacterized protein PFICI_12432 [Pestalotiopsis fici W106-1]ETS75488.1 hypothetical protein PFICI_12432 [Pestalotiopsis fici W106-1]